MNLRQMEIFRATMLTGTASGAATLLGVSSPSVSKSLGLIQRRTGLRLFQLAGGRLVPTPEARELYAEIERIWTSIERVRDMAKDLAHPKAGRLNIVCSSSMGAIVVPRALGDVFAASPRLRSEIEMVIPDVLLGSLATHAADVGVAAFRVKHPSIAVVRSYACGFVCVMPKAHPLAGLTFIDPIQLAGQRLVRISDEALRDLSIEEIYGSAAKELDFSLEVRAGQSGALCVLAGLGLAVVDAASVAGNIFPQLEVRRLRTDARCVVNIVHNRSKPLSTQARAFCDAFDRHWMSLVNIL